MTPQKPSQFGICSWSTHPKDPADLAGRLKGLGLDKMQLHLQPVYQMPEVWSDVQAYLKSQGMTVVSGMFGTAGEDYTSLDTIRQTGGFIPDQHWDANWKTVQETAKVSAKMGLKLVSCHAGFLPSDRKDPSFNKLADRLAQVAKHFGQSGCTLLFETGQETADTLWQFLGALDERGATNTGVNFDPANMLLYDKGDPIVSLKKLMPRVKQVHIKDAVRTKTPGTWGLETAIGEGEVDWKAFMRTLAEADYVGNLIIEREAGEDRVGDVRKAIERISKLM
jgi:L-ribulose-5-phosphate 3-epimerase